MSTYTMRRKMIALKNLGSDVDKKLVESAELKVQIAETKLRVAKTEVRIAELRLASNLLSMVQAGVAIRADSSPDFSICKNCAFKTCHLCELPDELREAH